MEKKEKKYGIQSNVHVPNMQDIQKAASDYYEEAGPLDPKPGFVAKNAKHFISPEKDNKFDPLLENIKKEMMQLGKVIATEETAAGDQLEISELTELSGPTEHDNEEKVEDMANSNEEKVDDAANSDTAIF